VPRAMARKQQGRGRDKAGQTSKTPPGGSGKGRRRPRKDATEMAAVPRTGCVIQGRGNRLCAANALSASAHHIRNRPCPTQWRGCRRAACDGLCHAWQGSLRTSDSELRSICARVTPRVHDQWGLTSGQSALTDP
jgi:hypothetical protein